MQRLPQFLLLVPKVVGGTCAHPVDLLLHVGELSAGTGGLLRYLVGIQPSHPRQFLGQRRLLGL